MHSNRLIPVLLIVPCLALGAAGCGSDKKDSSSTNGSSASISKKEFLRKGNAICAAGNKEINSQGKKLFGTQQKQKKPSKSEMRQFATVVLIPSVQKQVDQIKALGTPKGDEAKVNAILDAAQQGIDESKKNPLVLTDEGGKDPFKKANKLARDYGLKVCGS
jgi:hypothetical protein